MDEITVTLPDSSVRSFVHDRIAEGSFSSASDYVVSLINEDRRRRERAKLEKLLLEGLDGEAVPVTDAMWDEMRREYERRHAQDGKP